MTVTPVMLFFYVFLILRNRVVGEIVGGQNSRNNWRYPVYRVGRLLWPRKDSEHRVKRAVRFSLFFDSCCAGLVADVVCAAFKTAYRQCGYFHKPASFAPALATPPLSAHSGYLTGDWLAVGV